MAPGWMGNPANVGTDTEAGVAGGDHQGRGVTPVPPNKEGDENPEAASTSAAAAAAAPVSNSSNNEVCRRVSVRRLPF